MKVVNNELGKSQLECTSSKARRRQGRGDNGFLTPNTGFCFPSHCTVVRNSTSCVRDSLPKKYEMKEIVCEKCLEGRVKVRPVVESRNICRNKRSGQNRDSLYPKMLERYQFCTF